MALFSLKVNGQLKMCGSTCNRVFNGVIPISNTLWISSLSGRIYHSWTQRVPLFNRNGDWRH